MDNENETLDKDDYFNNIELTEDEQQIFHKLKECDNRLQNHDFIQNQRDEWMKLTNIGSKLSFDLYSKLTSRGVSVKFNNYCLKNMSNDVGGGPELLEFHDHIDVIKDIVSFIEFKHAHDDIGDVTLGIECNFEVYCKRRSSYGLIYRTPAFIKRTPNGWWVKYLKINKETDKQCSALLKLIESQAILLPKDVDLAFNYLWEKAKEGLEIGDFKNKLKEIANWIEVTEHGRPDWF